MHLKTASLLSLLALLFVNAPMQSQFTDSIRVMTYQIPNISLMYDPGQEIANILYGTKPDILITQEFSEIRFGNSNVTMEYLYGIIADTRAGDDYLPVEFVNGPDTDPICIYDSNKVTFLGSYYIATELRNVGEYHFATRNTRDSFRLYSCQLKEGTDSARVNQRAREALRIRRRIDTLVQEARRRGSADTLFMVAGNLNIQSSDEPAYTLLTTRIDTETEGSIVVDPLQRPGHWSGNSEFADLHTASTRMTPMDTLRGGSKDQGGGLDDRFDQILISPALMDNYVPGSYKAYGNDGEHFRDSVTSLPNTAVSGEIAQALYLVSDHLPVISDFAFNRAPSGVAEGGSPRLIAVSISPQPAGDRITLRVQSPISGHLTIRLIDATGETVLRTSTTTPVGGNHVIDLDLRSLPAGIYGYSVASATSVASGKLVVVR